MTTSNAPARGVAVRSAEMGRPISISAYGVNRDES